MAAKTDPAALTAVIASLKDADATVRDAAVLGLLRLGRHAAGAGRCYGRRARTAIPWCASM
jgi:hypothetical protein